MSKISNPQTIDTGRGSTLPPSSEFPPNMNESDRIIYKPAAFKGATIYIYEDKKLSPEQLITIIMDLVDEDVQAQKIDAHNRLRERRHMLDEKRLTENRMRQTNFDGMNLDYNSINEKKMPFLHNESGDESDFPFYTRTNNKPKMQVIE